jgi:FAD/FMN-containing dehydrogenase
MSSAPIEPTASTRTPVPAPVRDDLRAQLAAAVGEQHVLSAPETLDYYSSDVFEEGLPAELVVRPGTVEEAAAVVRRCTDLGRVVIPRGAGLSYTRGYLPIQTHSVIVDLERLNRIIEVNATDLYATVECGVTWHQLHEALAPQGLRAPYWGTVSGFHATIGGGLSQGAAHFGCAEFGSSSESCLGLEVLLADGSIVATGSASSRYAPTPFYRSYGPDLTGLFLNDTGALGIKLRATLALIPAPPAQRFASIAFESLEQLLASMAEVSRQGLGAEIGGWSPELARRFSSASPDLGEDLKYLAAVVRSGSSVLGGLRDAAKIALTRRRDWDGGFFLMHVTIDALGEAAAEEKLAAVERIAGHHGGRSIAASFPRAHHARPFSDLRDNTFTARDERTLPTHALCPHSRALEIANNVYEIFRGHETLMADHDISWALITSIVGRRTTLIEPLMNYRDARGEHYQRIPRDGGAPLKLGDADRPQIAALQTIRRSLTEMFMRHGCAHLQIGKTYPYREGRAANTWRLIEGLKDQVDPRGLMNPGSLGLIPAR